MKDAKSQILYIGKAKDLQKRLKSYFLGAPTSKIETILNQVEKIDYIVTSSEKEALILECNLIKLHKPKYNVVLRDDKNYPYLRIDLGEKWPHFKIVRRMQKDGAHYFGPFASAKAVRATLKSMERLFPLRTCKDFVLTHRKRPCLKYQIGCCLAPCVGYVKEKEYKEIAKEACLFLDGRTKGLLETFERELKEAASILEFERAAFYRDRIAAIKRTLEKQIVVCSDFISRDIIAFLSWPNEDRIEVVVLQIKNGYLLGEKNYTLPLCMATPEEAFERFLEQYYHLQDFIPTEIVVSFLPANKEVLEEWLIDKAGEEVRFVTPQMDEHRRLLSMGKLNLEHLLETKLAKSDVLNALRSALNLSHLPKRIECFDISNIQGEYTVASMAVFIGGQPAKDEYRHFKLSLEGKPNDYAMMQEVLKRRFEKEGVLPDLLLIDGGRGQLNIALKVLKEMGLKNISVAAVAKGKKGEEDKIYVPQRKTPFLFKNHVSVLNLLKHIRDEAHRFAINYYKHLHRKALLDSLLDNVRGIGTKRKALIWQRFKSLQELKQAPLEVLCQLGLPYPVAKDLKNTLTKV